MSVNTKLTAIADEIRTLSGTTGTMGLDAMANNVAAANEEVSEQVTLLAQAVAALEDKSAGSGGSGSNGGENVKTCTVSISGAANTAVYFMQSTDGVNVNIVTQTTVGTIFGFVVCENVVCNSLMCFGQNVSSATGTAEVIYNSSEYTVIKAPSVADEEADVS